MLFTQRCIFKPQFLSRYQYFPNERGTVSGFGAAPSSRRDQGGGGAGRHAWGQGNQLGGN